MSLNFELNKEITGEMASTLAVRFPREDIEAAFPLSPTQAGMLFHGLFAPNAGVYLEQIVFRIDGELDVQLFEKAWQRVVDHNEILRTSFRWEGLERSLQIVHRQVRLPFQQYDWRELSQVEQESRFEAFIVADREAGFDFLKPPLMRVALIRLADNLYRLVWTNHHTLLDGWSQSLVLKQVFTSYRALSKSEEPALEPSPPNQNYVDWLAGQDFREAELFWTQTLKGFTAPTALAIDRFTAESHTEVLAHGEIELQLPVDSTARLQAFGRKHRLTMFTLVQGAWALLLSRYSGTEDVVFGTAVSVRPPELPDIESAVGLFINTIPVRARLNAETGILRWLQGLQMDAVEAREHQHTPLVEIQRWSDVPRGLPLFESVLVFENYPTDRDLYDLGDRINLRLSHANLSRTNYLLTVLAAPGPQLGLKVVYDANRFERSTIGRMLGHLETILAGIVADPTAKPGELPLLTLDECRQLLVEWNQTGTEYEKDLCVCQLFEKQAARTPDAIAVVFEDQQLTYAELNARANQLAHHLRRLGVGAESLVGICVERSVSTIVGLLGILKASGAYLPLDPAFPKERLAFMIEDANVSVLLTQRKLTRELPTHQAKLVCLDSDWDVIADEPENNPVARATTDNTAYVIYTSGSTGQPKGVQIGHRALANFLQSVRREPGLTADDVLLSVTTLSFDIAALELYLPLIVGARLVIVSRDVAADGNQLKAKLAEARATVVQATPATWKMLIDVGWRGSEQIKVLCGGEALNRELASQLLERSGSLWNMYGPTETTIWSTVCKVESLDEPVSIGRPLANTKVYLLDKNLNPVPIGVAGELHIGGDGLARGYLNRPELTKEKFIRNPFSDDPDSRLYKTGDLARYLSDGRIECLGRIDNQVKIRGFRIELGEIESVLRQHAAVRESAVVAREEGPGDKRLVAYIVPRPELEVDQKALRVFLQAQLPAYMVPSAMVELAELPLTPNGKVNRRALQAPDYDPHLKQSYVAPGTPIEKQLAEIWSAVLHVPRVGIHDNFFELGGHSLLATQIVSRVLKGLDVQLSLRALFEAPTVATLAERIDRLSGSEETEAVSAIVHTARQGAAPLSFAQQRLWFLDQLEGESGSYNISRAVRVTGQLDVSALQKALSAIVSRHESLRTNFALVDGDPVQIISPSREMEISLIDLKGEREPAVQQLASQISRRPFDLAHDLLLRASLFQLAEREHLLLLMMHHIVSDGWSMGILFRELGALYEAFVEGQPSPLADLPIQYPEFALWQREWLQGEVLEKQLLYWRKQLAGAPAVLELPTDRPRPPVQTFNGACHSIVLPQPLRDSLSELSRRADTTLFMTLLAAFQTMLCRYARQEDIVLGTPIANRTRRETEDLVGLFVNTLVMRTDLSGNPSFRNLVRRVREVALQAYAHQDLPFEKLVEELKPDRSLAHMPLFQVFFAVQNAPEETLTLPGLELKEFSLEAQTAKFDLSLYIEESSAGLRLIFEYNTDLFNAARIERMSRHFERLLTAIVSNPDQPVAELPLLDEAERRQLLVEWTDTRAAYPFRCIHELFADQAAKTPDDVAVISADEQITFAELDQRTNQLAHYLQKRGVGPESVVAICLERSIEMVVALLGILRAGGAFVPVDPSYPAERVAFLLEDSQAPILLTQQSLLETLPTSAAQAICLDVGWADIARESTTAPACDATPENAAYVIYTSGSTGTPKGTVSPHYASVNRFDWMWRTYPFADDEVCCQKTSLSFVDSIWENFGPLLRGIPIAIIPEDAAKDSHRLVENLSAHGVTRLVLVPSLLRAILEQETDLAKKLPRLKYWTCSGEALPLDLAQLFKQKLSGAVLINLYGSSEVAADVTCYEAVEPAQLGSIPIGRPIDNTAAYILDAFFEPVPVGICGELYIAGAGLARGYLDRAELTAGRFLPNPFSDEPGARMFRTGDLARYQEDGSIEFLGREDYQVKIRGVRIEPGEIESVLRQHESVRESVVVAREDVPGDRRLVAYVVSNNGLVNRKELRRFLQQKLPDYMSPSVIVELPELPLTPNGKVSRRVLPPPDYDEQFKETYLAPRTPAQESLARIWADVLQVSRVGINDNFFELGGHSLLAVRLFARIEKDFGKHLPLATLFQAPTVRQLALILCEEGWSAPWSSLVVIQDSQLNRSKRPLFCVHALGGNVLELHDLAHCLGPDQPFYAFQSVGLDGRQAPLTRIEEMAAHYIKEMRDVQAMGPYLLAGRSFGGTVAYEMACQLRRQGEQIGLVALLDTYPIGYFKLQPDSDTRTYRARRFIRRMRCHTDNLQRLPLKEKIEYLIEKSKFAPAKSRHWLLQRVYRLFERFNRTLPETLRSIEQLNYMAALEYLPRVYDGRVALFWASGDMTTAYDLLEGWRALASGGIEVHEIPGNHIDIVREPHVRSLAAELTACLDEVQEKQSRTVRVA